MWTYSQSTGKLSRDGVLLCVGYSGCGAGLNCPATENVRDVGPIPRGTYLIGRPVDTPKEGPCVLPLTPEPGNEMFGRAGFLIHGDNFLRNRSASEGCIVVSGVVARERIAASGDFELEVVA